MKKGLFIIAFYFCISDVLFASQFKNNPSASGIMGGFGGLFDLLVTLGLGISVIALMKDILVNKNTNIMGKVILLFVAIAAYIIIRAAFY